ncbi:MAG: hypothetical protein JWQ44_2910 [Chthoniobacter sp.]|nr:hypothetical protein [Chthoniobacter sp.]
MSDIEKKAAEKEAAVQKAVSRTAAEVEAAPQRVAADKAVEAQAAVGRAAVERVVAEKAAEDKAAIARATAEDVKVGVETLPVDRQSIEDRAHDQVPQLPTPNVADTLPALNRPRIATPLDGGDEDAATMTVVTIAPGAGVDGLIAVGSRIDVKPSLFSAVWMRPATNGDARKLEAWRKNKV